MPFTKVQNRRIYITALVLSFLLIAGSIYLHIRQKHHLGRLSFNRDFKPADGVEYMTKTEEPENIDSSAASDEIDFNEKIKQFDRTDDDDLKKMSLSNECINCLCMTVNECQTTYCRPGEPCGLFRISKLYWIDGGKPILGINDYYDQNALEVEEQSEYTTCVNDRVCAVDTIQHYINKYKRDCNKDGIIDCKDHIALHLLGPTGCMKNNMSFTHASRMEKCLKMMASYYSFGQILSKVKF